MTKHHNLTNADMNKAILHFAKSIVDGDLILFYFSGHGYQVHGRNYLMPVDDEQIETDLDVESYAFDAEKMLDTIAKRNRSSVTIFILDCCRIYWPSNVARKKGIRQYCYILLHRGTTPIFLFR